MTKPVAPLGVLFDMDGVLVDSEEFIAKASIMMFAEKGLKVTRKDFEPFIGTGEDRFIGGVAEKYKFPLDLKTAKSRVYDIYLEIIKGKLKPLPGVHDFLKKCRDMGKKTALASSADRRKVLGNLVEIGLEPLTFDTIVTAEDVTYKKPNPEIFLLAAKRLNLNPKDCLVIEDAVTGVAAGKAAGAKCLGITSSFTEDQLKAADFFAKSLADAPDAVLAW